jgi:hypothetical protein
MFLFLFLPCVQEESFLMLFLYIYVNPEYYEPSMD